MPCTEAYREHIMYTFHGFCKTVIRFAAINAWRDRNRRQKEISLEYLSEVSIWKSAILKGLRTTFPKTEAILANAPTTTKTVLEEGGQTYCLIHSNSLSNKMDNSLLAVRGINHKYIVVEEVLFIGNMKCAWQFLLDNLEYSNCIIL